MKNHLNTLASIACLAIIFSSCANNAAYKASREAAVASSKETNSKCFIEKKDGSIAYFQTLELVTGPFKSPYLLADGKSKIKGSDIIAYQNQHYYAVSQIMFTNKKVSHVATETLPGFAVRLAKGKLNIYCAKVYNGHNAVDEFFIQSGNGKILPYSTELLTEAIKDNPQAYEFFMSADDKGSLPERIHSTARIYNTGQIASAR
ncbi:MAG: hypothetical protein IT254_04875 [Chitinophagaceae bacterium]|nr:hypothetical protein [Bacteroidota bacterium]MCC6257634.1 hypothetical protein [Chitinophagaceae bacterium]MCW5916943.1 hypothetical protein [Ferruginibacter sp.]